MWKLYVLSSALWSLNRSHRIRESKVIKTFYAGCFALTFSLFGFADKPANVLVIMVDDIGYADMSFLPQAPGDVHTPHLDRLADSGTYFSNAYATAPICSPSRAGFITGRYQQRWGNYWYGQGGLPDSEITLAHALRSDKYFCHKVGKTHLNGGVAEHPLDHGFDQYLGFIHHTWDYIRLSEKDLAAYKKRSSQLGILNVGPLIRNRNERVSYEAGFTTEIFTDEAVKTIERYAKASSPFYIQLEHNAVHMPTYVTDPAYAKKAGYEQPPWDRNAENWEFPFWDPKKLRWADWHKKWGHLGAVDALGRKRYLANLMALDDSVGKLLDVLEKTDQRKNTVVVFLSDNGGTINTYANNAPLRGYKYMFGEGGIRIPMIVSWPGGGLATGKTSEALVSAMDVFPTILELTGSSFSAIGLDGKSLVPLLKNGVESKGHEQLCWAKGKDNTWVIRKGPWKLISTQGWDHTNYVLDASGMAKSAAPYSYPKGISLFNLDDDIGETKNLADQYPERVLAMTTAWKAWRAEMGQPVRGKKKKK